MKTSYTHHIMPDKKAGPAGKSRQYLCVCRATGHNFCEFSRNAAIDFLGKYANYGATVDEVIVSSRRMELLERPTWLKRKEG